MTHIGVGTGASVGVVIHTIQDIFHRTTITTTTLHTTEAVVAITDQILCTALQIALAQVALHRISQAPALQRLMVEVDIVAQVVRLLVVVSIVVLQAVARVLQIRSIAVTAIVIAIPATKTHSTSAMTTTHSVALRQALEVILAAMAVADTTQAAATAAVRVDDSWYRLCI